MWDRPWRGNLLRALAGRSGRDRALANRMKLEEQERSGRSRDARQLHHDVCRQRGGEPEDRARPDAPVRAFRALGPT
jgi:hypothetical protein